MKEELKDKEEDKINNSSEEKNPFLMRDTIFVDCRRYFADYKDGKQQEEKQDLK